MLIQFEKIAPVLVDERKMRGDDDLLRRDPSGIGDRRRPDELPDSGIFIDAEPPRGAVGESERIELRLMLKSYRACCRKGKRQLLYKFGGYSQPVQRRELALELF